MAFKYINYTLWLIFSMLAQILVFNNILLFGYATPFLYVYLIFLMDSSIVSRNQLMMWAFALGLLVDIGTNTLGVNTAATVLLAFCRPTLLDMFCQINDDSDNIAPSVSTMGISGYLKYIFSGVFIHHLLLIGVEFFKVNSLGTFSLRVISSTILTTFCLFAIERVRNK